MPLVTVTLLLWMKKKYNQKGAKEITDLTYGPSIWKACYDTVHTFLYGALVQILDFL